jgi:hypothetical protein
MTKTTGNGKSRGFSRRQVLHMAAALGSGAMGAPYLLREAQAQGTDLGPYQQAKINWRQAEGEQITVGHPCELLRKPDHHLA